jgi:hypothetical protein
MGCSAGTNHYATGIQILGQGCQTRIWTDILDQVGTFLTNPSMPTNPPNSPLSSPQPDHRESTTQTPYTYSSTTMELDLFPQT